MKWGKTRWWLVVSGWGTARDKWAVLTQWYSQWVYLTGRYYWSMSIFITLLTFCHRLDFDHLCEGYWGVETELSELITGLEVINMSDFMGNFMLRRSMKIVGTCFERNFTCYLKDSKTLYFDCRTHKSTLIIYILTYRILSYSTIFITDSLTCFIVRPWANPMLHVDTLCRLYTSS